MTSIRTEEELDQINQKEGNKAVENHQLVNMTLPEKAAENKGRVNVMPPDDVMMTDEVLEIENTELESADGPVCLVCGKETSGTHHCSLCFKPVPIICGVSCGEAYGSQVQ
ncbi:hypothetical protein MML48_5g00000864 [Holotrichia oblita]|uniref:Uncharacterized protein n=1 Tax=Holotrichia oblita TaxID=644536 RepID=A0ACB9T4R6_HOLOL|nr:hypothetical protein MML48_5g00000864 [Holotrichia oblita]